MIYIGKDKDGNNKCRGTVGGIHIGNRCLGVYSDGGKVTKDTTSRSTALDIDELKECFNRADRRMSTASNMFVKNGVAYWRPLIDDDIRHTDIWGNAINGRLPATTNALFRGYTSDAVDPENRYVGVALRVTAPTKQDAGGAFYLDNANIYQQTILWYFDDGNGWTKMLDFYDGGVVDYVLSDTTNTKSLKIKVQSISQEDWIAGITVKPNTDRVAKLHYVPSTLAYDVMVMDSTTSVGFHMVNETWDATTKVYVMAKDAETGETQALTQEELGVDSNNTEISTGENKMGWGYLLITPNGEAMPTYTIPSDYDINDLQFIAEKNNYFSTITKPYNAIKYNFPLSGGRMGYSYTVRTEEYMKIESKTSNGVTYSHWNTKSDGSGVDFGVGEMVLSSSIKNLYAV